MLKLALLAVLWLAATVAATDGDDPNDIGAMADQMIGRLNVVPDETEFDRLIVVWDDTHISAMHAIKINDVVSRCSTNMSFSHEGGGGSIMQLHGRKSMEEATAMIEALTASPFVKSVEVDRRMYIQFAPNDPDYAKQWHYNLPTITKGGMNLPPAWDVARGAGVVVAVVDTGVRYHADLAANLLPGYDMISDITTANDGTGRDSDPTDPGDYDPTNSRSTSSWHGTHCAGTVAAVTNNGVGVAGVAHGAKVVPVRVLGNGGGYTSDIADGIKWAAGIAVSGAPVNANPAKVISMSLGGSGACTAGSVFQLAVDAAVAAGAVVVVAAGNDSKDASLYSPASCNNVITVAAHGPAGNRAYYSNFGAKVDVSGPGGDSSGGATNQVYSTLNAGQTKPGADSYAWSQGTSMATPHVAGLAALVLSVNPRLTPAQVESVIKTTAAAFPATSDCSSKLCGTGLADAYAAVKKAAQLWTPSPSPKGTAVAGKSPSPVAPPKSPSPVLARLPTPSPSPARSTTVIPDTCPKALPIPLGGSVTGDTRQASFDSFPFSCYSYHTAAQLYYYVNAPGPGILLLSLCNGATWDTVLSTDYGSSCNALFCLGDSNNYCGYQSAVSIRVYSPTRIYAMVHGNLWSTGPFTLRALWTASVAQTNLGAEDQPPEVVPMDASPPPDQDTCPAVHGRFSAQDWQSDISRCSLDALMQVTRDYGCTVVDDGCRVIECAQPLPDAVRQQVANGCI